MLYYMNEQITFPVLKAFRILAAVAIMGGAIAAPSHIPTSAPVEAVAAEQPEAREVEMVTRWVLPNATANEGIILAALQERGITDQAALAVIMGNIKQESRFHADICEGGARIAYQHCHRGGYGLIQWTTQGRYDGLGSHAVRVGHSPSSIHAQVSYLFTERQWRGIESSMKRPGQSIQYYMNKAYYWLGWGHHGKRTKYSWEYYYSLEQKEVPAK